MGFNATRIKGFSLKTEKIKKYGIWSFLTFILKLQCVNDPVSSFTCILYRDRVNKLGCLGKEKYFCVHCNGQFNGYFLSEATILTLKIAVFSYCGGNLLQIAEKTQLRDSEQLSIMGVSSYFVRGTINYPS